MRWVIPTLLILTGCSQEKTLLEPHLQHYPTEHLLKTYTPAYPPLSEQELKTSWGSALFVGNKLLYELDLYRAITFFKEAYILGQSVKAPQNRLQQCEFAIFFAYTLGGKWGEALDFFELSTLKKLTPNDPAFSSTLTLLAAGFTIEKEEHAFKEALKFIQPSHPDIAEKLALFHAIQSGNLSLIQQYPTLDPFRINFQTHALSPTYARTLNAILPGAGYFYVGQHQTALTALLLNALFALATWQLIRRRLYAWAFITFSLLLGWYLGGIHGAGLAAEQQQNALYNALSQQELQEKRLFPFLMINTGL